MVCLETVNGFNEITPDGRSVEGFMPALDFAEIVRNDTEYDFSKIDGENKYSEKYHECTGLVVVGVDQKTNKNISFVTHQTPKYVLDLEKNGESFADGLTRQLQEFKKRCKPGTIDALIVGGNRQPNYGNNKQGEGFFEYKKSIQKISDTIFPILGFKPRVATGPKLNSGKTSIFLDTKNRRLYLLMTEQKHTEVYNDFSPSDIDEHLEKIDFTFATPKPEDWEKLRKIRLEALQDSPEAYAATYEAEKDRSEESWKKILGDGEGNAPTKISVCIENKGEYVGMITANRRSDDIWRLGSVYVRSELRGKDISGALLAKIELQLYFLKAKKIELMVNATLPHAVDFYGRSGYRVVEELENVRMGDGKTYKELRMEKKLPSRVIE